MSLDPFHLAFGVHDLDQARSFYGELLGCQEGRSTEGWVDFDFFGHQLTVHLVRTPKGADATNDVDGDAVPLPHFGMVLDRPRWEELAQHLRRAGTDFVIEPRVRFQGQVGEQATLFFRDPSGNALEFKSFGGREAVFERDPTL